MMKLNQTGEKEPSIQKHLKEHKKLLARLKLIQKKTADGRECLKNRIKGVERIVQGRENALVELNGMDNDTVTVRTV